MIIAISGRKGILILVIACDSNGWPSSEAAVLRHQQFFGLSGDIASSFGVLSLLVTRARMYSSLRSTPRMAKSISVASMRLSKTNRDAE